MAFQSLNEHYKEAKEKIEKQKIEDGSFVNEWMESLLKETLIGHIPTMAILLKEGKVGSDALNLYCFYCFCSSKQRTTTVWATDSYCRTGLHWGEEKFRKAKNLLLKLKIISQKIQKDDKGKILKYYIRIHFLKNKETQSS
jgi:hypothetical protein